MDVLRARARPLNFVITSAILLRGVSKLVANFKSYLMREGRPELLVFDQHIALHTRVYN